MEITHTSISACCSIKKKYINLFYIISCYYSLDHRHCSFQCLIKMYLNKYEVEKAFNHKVLFSQKWNIVHVFDYYVFDSCNLLL